jgi:hypothetical protein
MVWRIDMGKIKNQTNEKLVECGIVEDFVVELRF